MAEARSGALHHFAQLSGFGGARARARARLLASSAARRRRAQRFLCGPRVRAHACVYCTPAAARLTRRAPLARTQRCGARPSRRATASCCCSPLPR
jgi:hypothetical protein